MIRVLDQCEDASSEMFTEEEGNTLKNDRTWQFASHNLTIPLIYAQLDEETRVDKAKNERVNSACHGSLGKGGFVDICHDGGYVDDFPVRCLPTTTLPNKSTLVKEFKTLIPEIRTVKSHTFIPNKGHDALDTIVTDMIKTLRKEGISLLDFEPPVFMDKEDGLKHFVTNLHGAVNPHGAVVGRNIAVYLECGRSVQHHDINNILDIITGTPIQSIDAGSGGAAAAKAVRENKGRWREGDNWTCENLYGVATYYVECLKETNHFLIISWVKSENGIYYHVFRSTGAISINEVIRILQENFRIREYDVGIRNVKDDDDECGSGSGSRNVKLIFASDSTINSSENIVGTIKTRHKDQISKNTDFGEPSVDRDMALACTLGLKTIGDRSCEIILQQQQQKIDILSTTDSFLLKILQLLYLTGKIKYLPNILIQTRGGWWLHKVPNNTTDELSERYMILKYWGSISTKSNGITEFMQRLRERFGLNILERMTTHDYFKRAEINPLASVRELWQRIEIRILKAINREFNKRCGIFQERMNDGVEKLDEAERMHNKEKILKVLSELPSVQELNPSVFIAELLGEESPFEDIAYTELGNRLIARELLRLINKNEPITRETNDTLTENLPTLYKGKRSSEIEKELDRIYSKCLPDPTYWDIFRDNIDNYFKGSLSSKNPAQKIIEPRFNKFKEELTKSDLFKSVTTVQSQSIFTILTKRQQFYTTVLDDVINQIEKEIEQKKKEKREENKLYAESTSDEIDSIYRFVDDGGGSSSSRGSRGASKIEINFKDIKLPIKVPVGTDYIKKERIMKELRERIQDSVYDDNDIKVEEEYMTIPSSIELLLEIKVKPWARSFTDDCNEAIKKRLEELSVYKLMSGGEISETFLNLGLESRESITLRDILKAAEPQHMGQTENKDVTKPKEETNRKSRTRKALEKAAMITQSIWETKAVKSTSAVDNTNPSFMLVGNRLQQTSPINVITVNPELNPALQAQLQPTRPKQPKPSKSRPTITKKGGIKSTLKRKRHSFNKKIKTIKKYPLHKKNKTSKKNKRPV
jgi:hypothetical protein